jgi:hypothetical protein
MVENLLLQVESDIFLVLFLGFHGWSLMSNFGFREFSVVYPSWSYSYYWSAYFIAAMASRRTSMCAQLIAISILRYVKPLNQGCAACLLTRDLHHQAILSLFTVIFYADNVHVTCSFKLLLQHYADNQQLLSLIQRNMHPCTICLSSTVMTYTCGITQAYSLFSIVLRADTSPPHLAFGSGDGQDVLIFWYWCINLYYLIFSLPITEVSDN